MIFPSPERAPAVAFLFPGHAVTLGAASAWAQAFPSAGRLLAEADRELGFPLSELMREGPLEQLRDTRFAQLATLAAGLACVQGLVESGIRASFVLGRSVGEFTAAVAAGALDFADAASVLTERGKAFRDACAIFPGSMAAIHEMDPHRAEELCRETAARTGGRCVVAGYNSPHRVTISGDPLSVEQACFSAAAQGAEILPLQVSGAFHSPLMAAAGERTARACADVRFKDPEIPMATGVDGGVHRDGESIKTNILAQTTRPVLWMDAVQALISQGARFFIEIAPGQGLACMAREIDPSVEALCAASPSDIRGIQSRLAALEAGCRAG